MPKAKKFINKKNGVTFHLVHRSQRDPLIADENAPQHVLVEANDKQAKSTGVEKRKEEERKYGVFYDDDYDYMQHLKDTSEVSVHWAPAHDPSNPPPIREKSQKKNVRINLPSSVFASEVEEKVGLLNKAAPQSGLRLDLDPDVVAAMDEDFNFDDPENQLEDNFMELAMKNDGEDNEAVYGDASDDESLDSQRGYASDDQYPESEDFDDDVDEDIMMKLRGYGAKSAKDDDGKSRFSQYSMTSSIMKRNAGLTLLDDKFEKMFAEYDDAEIGALDCDEIEGHLSATPDVLGKCVQQFEDQRRLYKLETDKETKKIVRMCGISEEDETEPTEEELYGTTESSKPKWDCESIISTYSNLYNHPKLIDEPKKEKKIKISAKTGMPKGVLDGSESGRVTMKSLAKLNLDNATRAKDGDSDEEGSVCESMVSTLSILSLRPKDETPDERKERKKLLKKYREERRIERKANTLAFKEEKKRQDKITVNNHKNVQGLKIV